MILRFVTERLRFLDGLAKFFGVALLKVECLGDILVGKGQVAKDADHVALLAVVLLIAIVVNDVLLSILEAHRDVIEVSDVPRIGQQVVPSQPLHRLLGNLGVLELVQEDVVRERELVVLLKVLALLLQPVHLRQLDCVEEVWEAFIYQDFSLGDCVAPLLQFFVHGSAQNNQNEHREAPS